MFSVPLFMYEFSPCYCFCISSRFLYIAWIIWERCGFYHAGLTWSGIQKISSNCWLQHIVSGLLLNAMALSRQGALFLLLLFLVSVCMPQIYACVPTCRKEFKKSFSLVQHKQSCAAALEMRKKSQQIRKDKGDDAFPIETSSFGRKQRLNVGVVSSC